METAKIGERSATCAATTSLLVKMYETLPLRSRKKKKRMTPTDSDVKSTIIVANLAPLEFPLPISFETLTLVHILLQNNNKKTLIGFLCRHFSFGHLYIHMYI